MKNKQELIDGNHAAAHIAYACNEMSAIYPITPSSPMAELCDIWSNLGRKNIFNTEMQIFQMQSESGASGAIHGSLSSGVTSTAFTSSQGLLLMIPTMYKIAGELKPCVFNVSSRAISTHALSIFADHSDVMSCRQTGFAMICASSPQEVMDNSLASNIATMESRVPFINFFDGFDTSHQIKNVDMIDYKDIKKIYPLKKYTEFSRRGLSAKKPYQQGVAQSPDIFFQNKEASNKYYQSLGPIIKKTFDKIHTITGRKYDFFEYYGPSLPKKLIILMGSAADNVEHYIDYLLQNNISELGLIKVRVYRPFLDDLLLNKIPKSVQKITVLDRTKEPGSSGEPLYLDVISSFHNNHTDIKTPAFFSGVYGLGGKELTPGMIKSIHDNMSKTNPKRRFSIGIYDDITNKSLDFDRNFDIDDKSLKIKIYAQGGEGAISSSKNLLNAINENSSFINSQAIFQHDSKKSGSLTVSNLKISKHKIKTNLTIKKANLIVLGSISYLEKFNIVSSLENNASLLIIGTQEKLLQTIDKANLQKILNKNIKIYVLDVKNIQKTHSILNRFNILMQGGIIKLLKLENHTEILSSVDMQNKNRYQETTNLLHAKNTQSLHLGYDSLQTIKHNELMKMLDKLDHVHTTDSNLSWRNDDPYFNNFIKPILELKGNELPVSSFNADGTVPTGTSRLEKREISDTIPIWDPIKCIQCNKCSLVCPHSAIKPVLISKEEAKKLDSNFYTVEAKGEKENLYYRIQINPYDCTGCGNCIDVCPTDALYNTNKKDLIDEEKKNYMASLNTENAASKFASSTTKGSQYVKPLFEFSGACAGCGETPYLKLLTQLFGDNMLIANATGCSSIYSGYAPTCPYTQNKDGEGPAWSSSLFENNAEFGYGIQRAKQKRFNDLEQKVNMFIENNMNDKKFYTLVSLFKMWKSNLNDRKKLISVAKLILAQVNNLQNGVNYKMLDFIENYKDVLSSPSTWIIGGDGWAYDIGYGGLDHIINSKDNINILILDNQSYSNTGGQVSKSTPKGAIAKFASKGKATNQKDLAKILLANENAYVATVSMGANPNQTVKAFLECEEFNGPSVIIAYSPCVSHGLDMRKTQSHMKDVVDSGYWPLFRYNPDNKKLVLDSVKSNPEKYVDFLKSETRFKAIDIKSIENEKNKMLEKIKFYKRMSEK